MPRKLLPTLTRLIAVRPDGARHVTTDRLTTLCGLTVTTDWYAGDAGDFGCEADCAKCYAAVKGTQPTV